MNYRSGKLRLLFFTILLIIVSLICFYENHALSEGNNKKAQEKQSNPAENTENKLEPNVIQTNFVSIIQEEIGFEHKKEKIKKDKIKPQEKHSINLSSDDKSLLARIAMAEAEGESIEGKALVIRVVLNRVSDDNFPDTIGDVIFQKVKGTYQFTPIKNGRFYKHEPNKDCWKAVEMVIDGWDESQGALYFESIKSINTWHSRNLQKLFECGGHKFYK